MTEYPGLRGFVPGLSQLWKVTKAPLFSLLALLLLSWPAAIFSQEPGGTWTEETLESLSLREKIGQLVQIGVPGKFVNRRSPEFQAVTGQIRENNIGGVVLFAGNVYESALLLNELQLLSKVPLLVAADFENGASFRIEDTTSFPWAMALGATGSEKYAYDQGFITGQESRALGVHWIFAPVMDVNNNPENPVINIRSFGEDPELVGRLGAAFIRGAKKAGVLTTAKHFPGHGDTATDSHIGLPVVESDPSRLRAVEFVPFRRAIEAGVDSIMTAHVAVPQLTDVPELPATLSSRILTGILRDTLKFDGLVVTDALEMGGITDSYWCGLAAVRALQAGADVLLMPPDATVAINEVERAVKRGDIPESRIDRSVRRILDAKSRMGLQHRRTVSTGRISEIVASPGSLRLAQDIADHSITVVKDERGLLPLDPLSDIRVFSLVLASSFESSPGTVFQAELRRHIPSVRTAWGNARISDELLEEIDEAVADSDLVVCSTLARLTSGRNTIAIPEYQQQILRKLSASGKPVIWVAFGNPYVLPIAPEIGTYMCTFSYSDVSQIAAAKAVAGEIAAAGRMPVSIPGHSRAGDGLQIPKLSMVLEPLSAGLSGIPSDEFEKTGKLLESFIEAGIFSGAELVAGRGGRIVMDLRAGRAADSARGAPAAHQLYSLSRVVGTSSAAMLAIDSGILLPEAPVYDYLPEFKDGDGGSITIRDLLTGTHGDATVTLDTRADLVEEIVARASGIPSDRYLGRKLFEPLGIKNIFRNPAKGVRGKQPASGGTRFFCGARDLAVFAQMLLNKGMYDHRRYFKPDTVAEYTGTESWWSKPPDLEWTPELLSPDAFGHVSPDGPVLWIDPARKLFVVLLMTDVNPSNAERIGEAQKKITSSVISQIANYE